MEISVDLVHKEPELTNKQTAIGVAILVVAVLAAILDPSFFLLLNAKSIYLRVAWKYMVMLLVLVPKLIFDGYNNILYFVECISDFAGPVFGLAVVNTLYVYLMYYSLTRTFAFHTLLLCSLPSTFIAAWKIASKQPFTRFDYVGIGINVFGAYLCCSEGGPLSSIISNLPLGYDILIGDFAAICAAAFGAVYMGYSEDLLSERRAATSVYFGLLSSYTILLCYILGQVTGENFTLFSVDPSTGFFGLFSTQYAVCECRENFQYAVLGLGVMSGFVLHVFPMVAREHIGAMFVSVGFNFAPFLAHVVGCVLDLQVFPRTFTIYAGLCLFIGCTLLAMDFNDQKSITSVPMIGKIEESNISANETNI